MTSFSLKLFLSVFFLPNFVLHYFGSYFATGVLWSVGVEEQFYLVWPWFNKKKRSSVSVVGIFLIYVAVKISLIAIAKTGYGTEVIEIGLKLLSHDVILVGWFIKDLEPLFAFSV